jgi:hypothetical protein
MKTKQFIYWSNSEIEGLTPIRIQERNLFFLINDSNLKHLKAQAEKEGLTKHGDFEWMINRWAVSIVNKPYLLNRFLAKKYIPLDRWTKAIVNIKQQ